MFIALEGIDGAGKTATAMHVGRLLRELGYPVTTFLKQRPEVRDPYVSRHLEQLRKLIWQHPPEDPYYLLGDYHWIHLSPHGSPRSGIAPSSRYSRRIRRSSSTTGYTKDWPGSA